MDGNLTWSGTPFSLFPGTRTSPVPVYVTVTIEDGVSVTYSPLRVGFCCVLFVHNKVSFDFVVYK